MLFNHDRNTKFYLLISEFSSSKEIFFGGLGLLALIARVLFIFLNYYGRKKHTRISGRFRIIIPPAIIDSYLNERSCYLNEPIFKQYGSFGEEFVFINPRYLKKWG